MITGKRILFIALKGYSDAIIKKLIASGNVVDYFNDKPSDGFLCKSLVRFRIKLYDGFITSYYKKIIEQCNGNTYDYIFVLRGEYITTDALKLLRKHFGESKMILYMWDSIKNNKGIETKWMYFDKVYSFDRHDCLKYPTLIFRPLFFVDLYSQYKNSKEDARYDLSFIGTAHGDRLHIISNVISQCKLFHKNYFTYLYSPHKFVFYYNKLFNPYYKQFTKNDVKFSMLPFEETAKICSLSKCIIDIENITQTGLTMRTIETLGLGKKLITTNKDIRYYDFYNDNNIAIVDRENIKVDFNFIDTPYQELSSAIYKKYSLDGWINDIFEEEKLK